jgi:hypothetical protein
MSPRKRKNRYREGLERRREEAARQQPEQEANEPEDGEAKPPSRILQERPPLLWPAKKRRPPWK